MPSQRKPFTCPVCSEDVPPNAKSCPSCGACDKSGWSGDTDVDGLDLPGDDDEFDYDKFLDDEFGRGAKPRGKQRFWWWVAAFVLVIIFVAFLLNGFLLMR